MYVMHKKVYVSWSKNMKQSYVQYCNRGGGLKWNELPLVSEDAFSIPNNIPNNFGLTGINKNYQQGHKILRPH